MKSKPQLYQTSVSNEAKKKVTIVFEKGWIQEIVKENLGGVSIEIHDYDIDPSSLNKTKTDQDGKKYQITTLE